MDAGLTPYSRWWFGFETSVIADFFRLFGFSCVHSGTSVNQSAILTKCTTVPDAYFEEVLAARHDTLPSVIDPLPVKQRAWDRPSVDKDKMSILASMSNPVDRARMAAACFPHSGDWLTALPITSCGLCIDNEGCEW